jgi:Ankyrin repeats (many copies)
MSRLLKSFITSSATLQRKKHSSSRWHDGVGLLHEAAEKGNLDLARFFIEKLKFNINQMDHLGHTPLYHAAMCKNVQAVPTYVYPGAYDATLVFVKMVRFLLEEGADPNLVSSSGDSRNVFKYPLFQALQENEKTMSTRNKLFAYCSNMEQIQMFAANMTRTFHRIAVGDCCRLRLSCGMETRKWWMFCYSMEPF